MTTGRWTCFKLHCDETAADRLVHTAVAPLADGLEQDGLISSWFFERSVEPSYQLRLRFDLAGGNGSHTVSARVHERLGDVLTDTYERDLERYGPTTIDFSERMFYRDSQMVARALSLVHEAENDDLRWQFGLMAVMRLFDDFALSLLIQQRLLEGIRQQLLTERGAAKSLAAQTSRQYRGKRDAIEDALDPTRQASARWAGFVELLDVRAHATALERFELLSLERAGRLTVPLGALLSSYLRMFCNRLFTSGQPLQELILVTFLAKHIDDRLARIRG